MIITNETIDKWEAAWDIYGAASKDDDDFYAKQAAYRQTMTELLEGSLCVYCGQDAATFDHVIPKRAGGLTIPDNLLPVCRSCNNSKSGKLLNEWFVHCMRTLQRNMRLRQETDIWLRRIHHVSKMFISD